MGITYSHNSWPRRRNRGYIGGEILPATTREPVRINAVTLNSLAPKDFAHPARQVNPEVLA